MMEINNIKKELNNTVYTMWLQEMLKFWRSKSRIIGALMTPLFFMFFLAPGFISGFQFRRGGDVDINFFAPGLIGMSILFASLSGGISIIWDREFGILKGILVAPVSRLFVVFGKAVGEVTMALIQGILILIIALFIGVNYVSLIGVLGGVVVMFISGIGFIGLGIALASKIESHEEFQMAMTFLVMPIMMVSGAFFPITDIPLWLKSLVYVNPFTYGVEALRWCLFGSSAIPISLSITVISLFAIIMLGIAGKMFGKMKV